MLMVSFVVPAAFMTATFVATPVVVSVAIVTSIDNNRVVATLVISPLGATS
jgi:hypothetical protein